jgi:hypothetical protein
VQRQDELPGDRERAGQEFPDRIESGPVPVLDLVEDLVEQAVGAVFEGVQQGLPVRVPAVQGPDADPGLGRDVRQRDVAAFRSGPGKTAAGRTRARPPG